ncbi:MAG: 4Fe-4S ferredoxin, partial [Burkholderiales bacterium]|nr:4Fe-4S ferredoxin [Burkholderiales bacterium]
MSITNLLNNWSFYRKTRPFRGQYDLNVQYSEYKWAMALDLDICTGCNACTTACYAENNLPVVGKSRFHHGQVMHWIRIERYWDENMGEFPESGASFLPMMCQQCEAA